MNLKSGKTTANHLRFGWTATCTYRFWLPSSLSQGGGRDSECADHHSQSSDSLLAWWVFLVSNYGQYFLPQKQTSVAVVATAWGINMPSQQSLFILQWNFETLSSRFPFPNFVQFSIPIITFVPMGRSLYFLYLLHHHHMATTGRTCQFLPVYSLKRSIRNKQLWRRISALSWNLSTDIAQQVL
jgi:hypothetical protein